MEQDKPIDWDMDFNADPKQVFGDGTVHMIADPARPVKEDFDRIFIENDQRVRVGCEGLGPWWD